MRGVHATIVFFLDLQAILAS